MLLLLLLLFVILTNISDNLLAKDSNCNYFISKLNNSSATLNKRIIFFSVKFLTLDNTLFIIDSDKLLFIHFFKLFEFCFTQSPIVIFSHFCPLFNLSKTLVDGVPL